MTLEAFRELPWYVCDAIEEGLVNESNEGGGGEDIDLGTDEGLAAAGFTVRQAD